MNGPRKVAIPIPAELPVKVCLFLFFIFNVFNFNYQVFLRLRGNLPNEDHSDTIQHDKQTISIPNPRNQAEILSYSFDRVLGPACSQGDLCLGVDVIVDSCLQGKVNEKEFFSSKERFCVCIWTSLNYVLL